MSANRTELIKKMNSVTTDLLREKGYIGFVDVLLKMGKLTQKSYEEWRMGRVPYLERVVTINLAKISILLRALHTNSLKGGLRPSWTGYNRWGKGKKQALRFSKSGDPNVERAWATHYLLPKQDAKRVNGAAPAGSAQGTDQAALSASSQAAQ